MSKACFDKIRNDIKRLKPKYLFDLSLYITKLSFPYYVSELLTYLVIYCSFFICRFSKYIFRINV